MTGAAGGLSGGLWAAFGAELVPGAAFVLDAVGFDARMRAARAVVTGEGKLDQQSLVGKVVSEVATRARQAGVPCHAVVGTRELDAMGARILDLDRVIEASTLRQLEAAGERRWPRCSEGRRRSLSARTPGGAAPPPLGQRRGTATPAARSCRASASSNWSAISMCMPARTTIRSTLRSWRFSGKRVGRHQPAALAQPVGDVEHGVVLDLGLEREGEHRQLASRRRCSR